jgi:hypothetical protein
LRPAIALYLFYNAPDLLRLLQRSSCLHPRPRAGVPGGGVLRTALPTLFLHAFHGVIEAFQVSNKVSP